MRGGKEIHVAELTRAQVALGHRVQVLYRHGDQSSLAAPAVRIALPPPIGGLGGLPGTALFAAAAAHRARRMRRPDVVHAHGDWTEACCMSRYATAAHAPVVMTVHGGLNPRYLPQCRWCFARVDAFIALGDRVRRDLLRCGVPDDRVTVMSSGFDGDLVTAAAETVREPGLIVTVGSLDLVKNIETIIRAVLGLAGRVDVDLEIIGTGPEMHRLRLLARGNSRVRFLGQLPRAQVYRRLGAADAFVIASRRLPGKGEGVPTALLEAMALGRLSLVSTAATPFPVVADSGAYRTFDPDDEGELQKLIFEAVTDGWTRRQIGDRARRAVGHLGWPDLARRVDQVYERALRTHRSRR